MIKIGLLGFGTVGSGVYEILNDKKKELKNILDDDIEVEKILVRDLDKKRIVNVNRRDLLTTNVKDILDNEEIDIVVEVMGGIQPAYDYMCSALNSGKHVVTANKEVVSKYIEKIFEISEQNNRKFLFEASVGGGIPIIKSLNQISAINKITNIKGIMNGTTNYILTKMMDNSLSLNDALKLAQKLRYAELDPKDDIEGDDVARKLSILSTLAFNVKVNKENIAYRGISAIDKVDIKNFKAMKKSIKLMANATKNNTSITAYVEPVLVDDVSCFASVKDNYNMIAITGNTVQELQFYGAGAGKDPTANAVVCDIIDIFKIKDSIFELRKNQDEYSINYNMGEANYYFRVTAKNENEHKQIDNLLKKFDLKYETLKSGNELVFKIKSVNIEEMNEFILEVKMKFDNYCYARID